MLTLALMLIGGQAWILNGKIVITLESMQLLNCDVPCETALLDNSYSSSKWDMIKWEGAGQVHFQIYLPSN